MTRRAEAGMRGVISPTPRQLESMQVICEWSDRYGRTPSYSELAAELEVASRSCVHRLVEGLAERGWLEKEPRLPGSMRILRRPPMPDFGRIEWSLSARLAAAGHRR